MGLEISDWSAQVINVTSPTTQVDVQTLSDFVEDQMVTPPGLMVPEIQLPEGKIEDPTNPGIFSQIIMILNPPWQVQFWGGSGYTRIFGGKLIGGLSDQPMKATGTAGDITVLESPVDGITSVIVSTPQQQLIDDVAFIKALQDGAINIGIDPGLTGNDEGDFGVMTFRDTGGAVVMRVGLLDALGGSRTVTDPAAREMLFP